MTKREVIDFLGKSKRSVENYIASGALARGYIDGPNGKTAIFDRAEVEAFKARAAEVWEPARKHESRNSALVVTPPDFTVAGPRVPAPSALHHFLADVLKAYPAAQPKPWLTLAEAVEYSGLPASWLLAQARERKLRAVNVGTGKRDFWRFNREALAK